ncbi:MAG: hypothetical protein WC779_06450 [Candidatus Omnitrophota bacterium]|jgi:hypothetical protein
MNNNKDSFFDDLKRAYEMEERMASVLIDLCEPDITEGNISDPNLKKIRTMLLQIQKDTLRHKGIVGDMLADRAKGTVYE